MGYAVRGNSKFRKWAKKSKVGKPDRFGHIGSKNVTCALGHTKHGSHEEAQHCLYLDSQVKGGLIKSYETQKNFVLMVNEQKICTHRVDFLIEDNDGTKRVNEYKGKKLLGDRTWINKRKLFCALYPHIKYEVVTRG